MFCGRIEPTFLLQIGKLFVYHKVEYWAADWALPPEKCFRDIHTDHWIDVEKLVATMNYSQSYGFRLKPICGGEYKSRGAWSFMWDYLDK